MTGKFNTLDNIGTCLANAKTVGRKFPKRLRNPNASKHMPIRPHLNRTKAAPRKKHMVPLI